ncbi:MAG TPA: hypothetical protein PKA76_02575 [Pirellulaceae bacterium]|nr:hypothetical protein [Pirellulaceae bacterium]
MRSWGQGKGIERAGDGWTVEQVEGGAGGTKVLGRRSRLRFEVEGHGKVDEAGFRGGEGEDGGRWRWLAVSVSLEGQGQGRQGEEEEGKWGREQPDEKMTRWHRQVHGRFFSD